VERKFDWLMLSGQLSLASLIFLFCGLALTPLVPREPATTMVFVWFFLAIASGAGAWVIEYFYFKKIGKKHEFGED